MTYHSKPFLNASLAFLSRDIEDFLAANPTFVPVSLSLTLSGSVLSAILIYGV